MQRKKGLTWITLHDGKTKVCAYQKNSKDGMNPLVYKNEMSAEVMCMKYVENGYPCSVIKVGKYFYIKTYHIE